eukprot:scaffold3499_cov117-Isochrysis_galbana.AAC.24
MPQLAATTRPAPAPPAATGAPPPRPLPQQPAPAPRGPRRQVPPHSCRTRSTHPRVLAPPRTGTATPPLPTAGRAPAPAAPAREAASPPTADAPSPPAAARRACRTRLRNPRVLAPPRTGTATPPLPTAVRAPAPAAPAREAASPPTEGAPDRRPVPAFAVPVAPCHRAPRMTAAPPPPLQAHPPGPNEPSGPSAPPPRDPDCTPSAHRMAQQQPATPGSRPGWWRRTSTPPGFFEPRLRIASVGHGGPGLPRRRARGSAGRRLDLGVAPGADSPRRRIDRRRATGEVHRQLLRGRRPRRECGRTGSTEKGCPHTFGGTLHGGNPTRRRAELTVAQVLRLGWREPGGLPRQVRCRARAAGGNAERHSGIPQPARGARS